MEFLLLYPELLKNVGKLKALCLQNPAVTQWLISSSVVLSDQDGKSHRPHRKEDSKSKLPKSKYSPQKLRSMTKNATVTNSVLKFEREFNAELQSLEPLLSSNSQADHISTILHS